MLLHLHDFLSFLRYAAHLCDFSSYSMVFLYPMLTNAITMHSIDLKHDESLWLPVLADITTHLVGPRRRASLEQIPQAR